MLHGPERTAVPLLGLPRWWKGILEMLVAVATICLRIKANKEESPHHIGCGLQPSWEPDYTPHPFLFRQSKDFTLTVRMLTHSGLEAMSLGGTCLKGPKKAGLEGWVVDAEKVP